MGAVALQQILHRVARRTLAAPYRCWGYGEAVAMLGLLAAWRVTGKTRYRQAVEGLFARWRDARRNGLSFADHVTPGVPLLMLARDDATWIRSALALGHLFHRMPVVDGIPIHRPDLDGWTTYVWVDCLYTDGPFLALLARATGDRSWADLAVGQATAYIGALLDQRTGLFFHGYDVATGRPNGIFWGRGNGWALLGLVDLLRFLPGDHAGQEPLRTVVRRQLDALLALQDRSGHWHTVLDRPDTYLETSVAAMMAWAIPQAVRLGIVEPEDAAAAGRQRLCDAAARAYDAALAALDAQGRLTGVSEATPAGGLCTYANRPTGAFPWGQGPLLLATADRIAPDRLWEGSW
ncbi:MAG: glycoside hydrolase family 88 protein [Armatimonadota bacterium]|nr:glycoside hydrolase family 88 protein [Armatimonadota bacterium]